MADQGTKSARRGPTAGDMVRSLAIILVPLVLIYWLFTKDIEEQPVRSIDYAPTLREANERAPYTVMAPEGLGEGWIPTQSHYFDDGQLGRDGEPTQGHEWVVGFISPDEIYYGVLQTDHDAAETIGDLSRGGQQQGSETIEGREWERWRSPDGRTGVLATTADGVTLTVTADADFTQIADFARTLEPQKQKN